MSETVTYSSIHRYMLQKTQEYYGNPPDALIDNILEEKAREGQSISREEAKKLVSLIEIQRLIKQEMKEKWPEFMGAIPENPLKQE